MNLYDTRYEKSIRNDKKAAELQGDNELRRKFGSKRPGLDDLCRYCSSHYGSHTYDDKVAAYTKCPHPEREENDGDWRERIKKFWVCWVQGTTVDKFYMHFTLLEAENEAERLAKLPDVQGKEVYIFECIGKCHTVSPVVAWVVTR